MARIAALVNCFNKKFTQNKALDACVGQREGCVSGGGWKTGSHVAWFHLKLRRGWPMNRLWTPRFCKEFLMKIGWPMILDSYRGISGLRWTISLGISIWCPFHWRFPIAFLWYFEKFLTNSSGSSPGPGLDIQETFFQSLSHLKFRNRKATWMYTYTFIHTHIHCIKHKMWVCRHSTGATGAYISITNSGHPNDSCCGCFFEIRI